MFLQGRVILTWLFWFLGGVFGVIIILVVIYYCRLMPRHQKSFDEQYLKETYTIKENHVYISQGGYTRVKTTESRGGRSGGSGTRPASYAGGVGPPPTAPTHPAQYASSGILDELEGGGGVDGGEGGEALKTRSLPAFLRPRPRPLSSETDLYQLYAKVAQSKKHKSRMRSEHAAIIALSKSRSQPLDDDAHAVIVYDQRTQL